MELQVLGDRYEMLEPIGRGGMATIYRAKDRRMGRMVAVKILREMYSNDPKFVLRFQREARAVSALAHPNIVQVFDYGQSNDAYYIVMELIEGVDLRKYLKQTGILDTRRAVVIGHDVALALGAAHRRGIVHRDVKPQNVLVNDEALVKLTDFGIATFYRDQQAERLTTTGMTLGTVQYYAPEQAQGEVVTPAADVYALGVVLYEMLVGHPPFDGDTPVAIAVRHIQEPPVRPSRYNPNIPPALERVILRCLEKDPRDRYRDGDALAYALETFDKPRSAGRISTPHGASSGPMRSPSRPLNESGRMGRPPSGPIYPDEMGGGYGGNSPTRADIAMGTMPRQGMGFEPVEDERPSPAAGITTAVIVASVLLLLAVSCFVSFKTGLIPNLFARSTQTTQQQIIVPNFVGMQYADALTKADNLGLHLKGTQVTAPDNTPQGQVLTQSATANSTIDITTLIVVTYAGPPNQATVPDVIGDDFTTACNLLKQNHLGCNKAGVATTYTQPVSTVETSDPPFGDTVPYNTVVRLYISPGPPTPTPSPSPVATVAPPQLSVTINEPTTPPCSAITGVSITITNSGGGTLHWLISPVGGLSYSQNSGSTTPGSPASVTITGTAPGTSTPIVVTNTDTNATQTVNLTCS